MAGRPRKTRDPKAAGTVKALAQYGVPHDQICAVLKENGLADICSDTLEKIYRKELDEGKALGDSKLLQTAFSMATKDKHAGMLCFLLKTRMGLRETNRIEMTSPDGTMSPGGLGIEVNFVNLDTDTEEQGDT